MVSAERLKDWTTPRSVITTIASTAVSTTARRRASPAAMAAARSVSVSSADRTARWSRMNSVTQAGWSEAGGSPPPLDATASASRVRRSTGPSTRRLIFMAMSRATATVPRPPMARVAIGAHSALR
jgi:hypothetical protein